MASVRIQQAASFRLDEIYRYTRDQGGERQADRYITGLFEACSKIASHGVASRPVPAELGVVTVLRERMHQIERFRGDFGL